MMKIELVLELLLLPFLLFLKHTTPYRCISRYTCRRKYSSPSSSHVLQATTAPNDDVDVDTTQYVLKTLNAINEINPEDWNSLFSRNDGIDEYNLFLDYHWLNALEESLCVTPANGWQPFHLLVMNEKANNSIVAAVPMYFKYHSYGEYIFDQSWAEYAEAVLNIKYYPKLLSAVPFSPVTGSRILIHPSMNAKQKEQLMKNIGLFLRSFTAEKRVSSINFNYIDKKQCDVLVDTGYLVRETVQYRFTNMNKKTLRPYDSFDDYLSLFLSKKRTTIKRERRSIAEQGVTVRVIRGDDDDATAELYQRMFEIYITTIEKKWGQQYLDETFFNMLYKQSNEFKRNLLFVVAVQDSTNEIIAGTFNVVSSSHFYGRYYGALVDNIKNLHFELCYYKAIEYCIEKGLQYIEPGAGRDDFKRERGFDPYIVNSAHSFTSSQLSAGVADFLYREKMQNKQVVDLLLNASYVAVK